jgi:sugar O-acyltransferase (sialic acid O-acetyltransferase NeuD family)
VNVEPLLIFPCNGNAIEALDCLGSRHRLLAFIDDDVEKRQTPMFGYAVGGRGLLEQEPDARLLAVPGSPTSYHVRRRVIEGLGQPSERFTSVIHPAATVSRLAKIGRNVLIMAGVVITSNAIIGDHVCILPNTVVHHDAVVGAWSLIGSNVTIAGGSVIGENCYVGSGTSIINGVEIGRDCLIGLAATVTRSIAPGARVAGSPARPLVNAG